MRDDTCATPRFGWNVTLPPHLYGALLSVLVLPLLPLTVGGLEFFIAHAFFFGLAGFFIISWRKRRWETACDSERRDRRDMQNNGRQENESMRDCGRSDDDRSECMEENTVPTCKVSSVEDYPRYLFEGTFYTLVAFDVLFTAAMCWRLSHVGIRKAAVDTWVDIYEDENVLRFIPTASSSNLAASMSDGSTFAKTQDDVISGTMTTTTPFFALEHCILASHVGFMIKDIFFCTRGGWEMTMPAHHLGACILLTMTYFSPEVPGIRLLALSTSVMELGSASFCAWIAWRLKFLYVITMTLSNTIYFACLCAILLHGGDLPWWINSAIALGFSFIVGRTAVLIQGMHKDYYYGDMTTERKMQ